jgi:hypothetical protein
MGVVNLEGGIRRGTFIRRGLTWCRAWSYGGRAFPVKVMNGGGG